jgi:hypothetical protein
VAPERVDVGPDDRPALGQPVGDPVGLGLREHGLRSAADHREGDRGDDHHERDQQEPEHDQLP